MRLCILCCIVACPDDGVSLWPMPGGALLIGLVTGQLMWTSCGSSIVPRSLPSLQSQLGISSVGWRRMVPFYQPCQTWTLLAMCTCFHTFLYVACFPTNHNIQTTAWVRCCGKALDSNYSHANESLIPSLVIGGVVEGVKAICSVRLRCQHQQIRYGGSSLTGGSGGQGLVLEIAADWISCLEL